VNGSGTDWREAVERACGSVTTSEGVRLLEGAPLFELGRAADAVRRRLHPDGVVTYIVDRNINYTNVCSCGCSFCAFYRKKDAPTPTFCRRRSSPPRSWTRSRRAGSAFCSRGAAPDWGIGEAVRLVRAVKRHPILLHGFSPPEVWHFAHQSKMTIGEVIARLSDAGLDSIPGGGRRSSTTRCVDGSAPRRSVGSSGRR